MEEDDDDFYGGGAGGGQADGEAAAEDSAGMQMDVSEEEEEEDSDDDVKFTLEKPADAKSEPASTTRTTRQQAAAASQDRTSSTDIKNSRASPAVKQEGRSESSQPAAAVKGTLTHDGKEGKDFPEIRTSKINLTATPVWPANEKPIIEVDLDADIAESSRLWRLPGTDQTDFFNYGFDEYTWAQYCLRQQEMAGNIADAKQQDAQLKAMFGGGGPGANGGGGGGANPGMPGMPGGMGGLPSPEEMMQQMLAMGLDPSDPNQFAQMMGNMAGGGGPPNAQPGGGPNFGGGGGFGGGPNQNTASPNPGAGQGFQPPSGPSQLGDQGGFPANMEGYSPQQIAIMQQQGNMGGAQGGRRGGRRGRGYY